MSRCDGCNKEFRENEQVIEVACIYTYCLGCTQPASMVGGELFLHEGALVLA